MKKPAQGGLRWGMNFFWGLLFAPFFAVLFFGTALWLSRKLWKRLPDSRIKRLLFSPLPGHRPRRWG
jgi:hypothetical protein